MYYVTIQEVHYRTSFIYLFIFYFNYHNIFQTLLNPCYYQQVETNHSTKGSQKIPIKVTDFQRYVQSILEQSFTYLCQISVKQLPGGRKQ